MKKFLDDLINRPFKPIEQIAFQQQGEEISFPNEHSGTFTIIPEVLRRCHFLSLTEKEVLYELISWASTTKIYEDGYCKVTESHISANTSIGLSTVKKAVSSLEKKGFIRKAVDFDRRNIYQINGASENPYIILSEWVHHYRTTLLHNWSVQLIDDPGPDYLLGRKIFIKATMLFIKEEKYHGDSINAIKEMINKVLYVKPNHSIDEEVIRAIDFVTDAIDKVYESLS